MIIDDQGSIVLFIPRNSEELTWLEDNTSADSWQWLGGSLAVDHHMAEDLIEGIRNAGFEIK